MFEEYNYVAAQFSNMYTVKSDQTIRNANELSPSDRYFTDFQDRKSLARSIRNFLGLRSVVRAWPLVVAFCIMAFIMAIVIAHHGVIFRMKYTKSKAFEQQQFAALDRMSPLRTGYSGWNVSGV